MNFFIDRRPRPFYIGLRRQRRKKMKIIKKEAYVLCWCGLDMMSNNGIEWPEKGVVEDPNWTPRRKLYDCLHGHLWGCGKSSEPLAFGSTRWIVARVNEYVEHDGYVTFPRAEVVFVGHYEEAVARLVSLGARFGIEGDNLEAPDYGKVIVGNYGSATAGDHGIAVAGAESLATTGKHGISVTGDDGSSCTEDYGIALTGDYGVAISKFHGGAAYAGYGGKAAVGDHGIAVAGIEGSAEAGSLGRAYAGKGGRAESDQGGTAIADCNGTASAGIDGIIAIHWFDGNRPRLAVGYVGEDGIEPYTLYRVENGRFIEVEE